MSYKNREDQLKAQRRWYQNNKNKHLQDCKKRKKKLNKWYKNYKKNLKCSNCSETHWSCLEFHHNENNKENLICKMAGNYCSKERIMEEIDKCVVLCANCHRKFHYP